MAYGLATIMLEGARQAVLVRGDRYVPLSHWGEERQLPELLADWQQIVGQLEQWSGDETAFGQGASFSDAEVLAPYRPGQVFCTGANYKKHVVGLIMGDPSMRTAEHENLSQDELKARVEAMIGRLKAMEHSA